MNVQETATKIRTMEIRGAGKIARAAAAALKELAQTPKTHDTQEFLAQLNNAKEILFNTRPTAISLANALDHVMAQALGDTVEEISSGVVQAANEFISNSKQAVKTIAEKCSERITNGDTILTHCNSTVAVNAIIDAHNTGKDIKVYATETRPWGQGYITSQALADAGVDVTLIVDSAVRLFMPEVKLVIFGADTVTADGTVYNKIGTSQIALCAHERRVPVIVCAETYKFSRSTVNDHDVRIEERDISEIIEPDKLRNVKIRNPVFDATPPEYIAEIVTEHGAIKPKDAGEIIRNSANAIS